MPEVTKASIEAAARSIAGRVGNTPLTTSETLSEMCGCRTLFKLENLQMTGSFKERGALNKLQSLSEAERNRGVIAASAGNHAQAIAYHARHLGIAATIVMPVASPLVKVRSTEHWGAKVILHGETFDDAYRHSQEIVRRDNLVYVHPFDDPLVIAGQGTLAVEILEHPDGADANVLLVPVGGGGLISGIAVYAKAVRPDIRIIGVEEQACAAMSEALQSGFPVELPPAPVIADGIAVRRVAEGNLQTVRESVDDVVTVTTDEIANAVMLMLEIEKLVVEGAAATTLAALVNRRVPDVQGQKVVSIISGGNIDMNQLARIINQGLSFDGRIAEFEVLVQDKPGALERLLGIFRAEGANILEIHHHRFSSVAPFGQIGVSVTAETRDRQHIEEIRHALRGAGYRLS